MLNLSLCIIEGEVSRIFNEHLNISHRVLVLADKWEWIRLVLDKKTYIEAD